MKKFLRFIGILILIAIVAVVVFGLIEPKDISVKRTVMIKAPQSVVYDQIVHFKNWPHWSPWYRMEPTAAVSYSGTDGEQGSSFSWDGKKMGQGSMSNTGMMNDNMMHYQLEFLKPWKSTATGYLMAKDTADMTQVTWTYEQKMPFPMNAMQVFVNIKKMLGNDFQNGLDTMKAYCEAHSKPPMAVEAMQFPGRIYAGVRRTISMNDSLMSVFFKNQYDTLSNMLNTHVSGMYSSIFYRWDTVTHTTDVAAAFPVTDSSTHMKGISYFYVPAGKAYKIKYVGPYSGIGTAHMEMMKYLAEKKEHPTMVLEEYATGPMQEKDSTKWQTNIYYEVQ